MEEKKKKIGTLIKSISIKRAKDANINFDSVLIFYRDENGVKQKKFVSRAQVPYYIIKDKNSEEAKTPPTFIKRELVEKSVTYSDMLYREIATKTGALSFYDRYSNNSPNLRNILKHPYVYDADMDIADRYIANFYEEYEPDPNYTLHKAYFDIEVDLMEHGFVKDKNGHIGYMDFPDEEIAPCPINIITLIDDVTMTIYTFIVKNNLNESQKEFFKHIPEFKKKILKNILNEDFVAMNDLVITIYNSEEECIEAFFNKTHELDPDFINSWNMSFDATTLLNRLKKCYKNKREIVENGINPYDRVITAVCDKNCLLEKDENGNDIYLTPRVYYKATKDKPVTDRSDEFVILDGINWIDQMTAYAAIRKSSGQKESYSLDAIGLEEVGKEKLDYTGYTIKDLAWKNFEMFVSYNIQDVFLLYLIEKKNLDMDLIQRLSDITNTRKEKVFRKTVSLKNFVSKYAQDNGYVMSNNKNAKYGNDYESFDSVYLNQIKVKEDSDVYKTAFEKRENFGAYVADPNLNEPEGITGITGKPSDKIFEYVGDEDFSSLYPSIIRAYNLDPNTQIGKFFLLDSHIKCNLIKNFNYDGLFAVSKNEEADSDVESGEDMGPTLVDSLSSQNWSEIGRKYFDLPSTQELIEELKKE